MKMDYRTSGGFVSMEEAKAQAYAGKTVSPGLCATELRDKSNVERGLDGCMSLIHQLDHVVDIAETRLAMVLRNYPDAPGKNSAEVRPVQSNLAESLDQQGQSLHRLLIRLQGIIDRIDL